MGRKYISMLQAQIFCMCPYRYYLQFIEKKPPTFKKHQLLSELTITTYSEMMQREEQIAKKISSSEDIAPAYVELTDLCIAHAMAIMSKHLDDIDFEEIIGHISARLMPEIVSMTHRFRNVMELCANDRMSISSYYCEKDEAYGKRVVDHRLKISATIPQIKDNGLSVMPILTSDTAPQTHCIESYYPMALEISARLAVTAYQKKAPLVAIYYIPLHEYKYYTVSEENELSIKSFVATINECNSYPAFNETCEKCPYMKSCKYYDNSNGSM